MSAKYVVALPAGDAREGRTRPPNATSYERLAAVGTKRASCRLIASGENFNSARLKIREMTVDDGKKTFEQKLREASLLVGVRNSKQRASAVERGMHHRISLWVASEISAARFVESE